MYTTLCKGTLGQKERNILQTSDVRWTDRLINLGCLQALYTCKFLVLFLKLIMVATMLTIKQDNTIFQPCNFSQYILDKLFYCNLSMCQICKIDPCTEMTSPYRFLLLISPLQYEVKQLISCFGRTTFNQLSVNQNSLKVYFSLNLIFSSQS